MPKQKTAETDFTKPPFVEITYNGKNYPVNVGSPTGVLLFQYGREFYGFYKKGAKFFVHEDDLRARPDLFRGVIPDETPAVESPPEDEGEPDPVDNLSDEPTETSKPARRKKS